MDKQAVVEMISAFVHGGQRIEKMSETDPMRVMGSKLGDRFTEGVAMLKGYPNPAIRALMAMVWDIVGNRIVPVALGPKVPSLTFGAMGSREKPDGIIFIPHEWEALITENPIYQLGALVFVGSQAVDYYNDRLLDNGRSEALLKRGRAHEAEYLVTIKEYSPDHEMNSWQTKVLEEFPEGLRSASIQPLLYKHKAFVRPA